MGSLYALMSSVLYGAADFAGGLLSRRASFAVVALVGQASGMALMFVLAPLLPGSATVADLAWGALSGVGTGGGMALLYRGLSRGPMSVVVPVCAVGGLALPVLVGIAVLGDRPTALAVTGMALTVPAIWLTVPRTAGGGHGGVADGLLASVFIAVQYLALAMASPASGLWPLLAGRVSATLTVLPMTWRELSTDKIIGRRNRRPPDLEWKAGGPRATGSCPQGRTPHTAARKNARSLVRLLTRPAHAPGRKPARASGSTLAWAAATGVCATLALVAYLLATHAQLVSIAVVLSSLYPAIPVLLGLTVLGERLTPRQVIGLLGAGTATALLTLG